MRPQVPPSTGPTFPPPPAGGVERSDWRGVPTTARGRRLDLGLAVATRVLTPHIARAARARLATAVRELHDFLFPNGRESRRDWPRIPSSNPCSGAPPLAAAGSRMNIPP